MNSTTGGPVGGKMYPEPWITPCNNQTNEQDIDINQVDVGSTLKTNGKIFLKISNIFLKISNIFWKFWIIFFWKFIFFWKISNIIFENLNYIWLLSNKFFWNFWNLFYEFLLNISQKLKRPNLFYPFYFFFKIFEIFFLNGDYRKKGLFMCWVFAAAGFYEKYGI